MVRCGAVRCGAVQCGAVRCGAVRCGVSQLFVVFFSVFLYALSCCCSCHATCKALVLLLRLRECFCPLFPFSIERDTNPFCRKDVKIDYFF